MMESTDAEIRCVHCERLFMYNRSLYRHLRNFHNTDKDSTVGSIVCAICGKKFDRLAAHNKHLQECHNDVKLSLQLKAFDNDEDFKTWFTGLEQENSCNFVKRSSSTRLADGRIATYFYCHRSGVPREKEVKTKHSKYSGSVKIGKTCPAYIKAYKRQTDEAIQIEVEYQTTHLGHQLSVGKTRLNQEERLHLASLMKQGISKTEILSYIRQKYCTTTRMGVVNYQDLSNIIRDFDIDNKVTFQKNDAMAIELKVRKLQQEEDNPVLIYKPVNDILYSYPQLKKDEFLLGIMNDAQLKLLELYGTDCIMIDSTYGTNQYGFQLTTIIVNDENHEGFPVAVLYSTSTNTKTFVPFIKAIKDKLKNELKTKVFISDDATAFYNAWIQVFGESDKYLLYTWHVIKSLNKNLNSKIRDSGLRQEVKSKVMRMLKEPDEATFLKNAKDFESHYMLNNETRDFAEYFELHYMQRAQIWAYCYRKDAAVNTNMKLEHWHKQIMYEEGYGKLIKRLDESLSLVLNAVSSKLKGRIISMERSNLTTKVKQIRQRHIKSKDMAIYSLIEIEANKSWTITKNSNNSILDAYNVEFFKHCSCNIKCDDCNSCIHQYTCTCVDYCVRFQMCKHIHFVLQNMNVQFVASLSHSENHIADVSLYEEVRYEEQTAIQKELKKTQVVDLGEKKSAIVTKLFSLLNKSQASDQVLMIEDAVKCLEAQFAIGEENVERFMLEVPTKTSVLKNVAPRRRFKSVKPKSKQV